MSGFIFWKKPMIQLTGIFPLLSLTTLIYHYLTPVTQLFFLRSWRSRSNFSYFIPKPFFPSQPLNVVLELPDFLNQHSSYTQTGSLQSGFFSISGFSSFCNLFRAPINVYIKWAQHHRWNWPSADSAENQSRFI